MSHDYRLYRDAGTRQIILTANDIYSTNETIRSSLIAAKAPALQFWGRAIQPGGVKAPFAGFLMIALVALPAYVLRHRGLRDDRGFGSVLPAASTGQLDNIQSISAVVIGGISLFGGHGSIMGRWFRRLDRPAIGDSPAKSRTNWG